MSSFWKWIRLNPKSSGWGKLHDISKTFRILWTTLVFEYSTLIGDCKVQGQWKRSSRSETGKRKTLKGIKFCSKRSGFYSLTRKNAEGLGLDCFLPPSLFPSPSLPHSHTPVQEWQREKRKSDRNTGVQLKSTDARVVAKISVLYTKVSVNSFNPGHRGDGDMQSLTGWAEKPLLKGTVSPRFQHCGIAVDSPEEKTTNKSTLQRAFRFSETELRTASEAKRAKHKQHQIPSLPCTKAEQRHSFHVAGWGFPCWPFTIVIRSLSFWYKGQQRAELVSTLVRRVFLDWRHLIGCWWVTDAEVHRQKHVIGCPPVSAFPATRLWWMVQREQKLSFGSVKMMRRGEGNYLHPHT